MLYEGASWSGHERNCAFLNTGRMPFATISAAADLDQMDDSRGLCLVDWDQDGDVDMWVANRTSPRMRFLKNNLGSDHQYLSLSLTGKTCNRDAIGARATITLQDG